MGIHENVHENGEQNPKRISAICISLLCYSTMSKLLPSIVRDTGSNLLVQ